MNEIAKDTENNVAANKSVECKKRDIHRITKDTNKSKAGNRKEDMDRILQLCKLVTEQTYDTNDITIKRLGKKTENDVEVDTAATRPTL